MGWSCGRGASERLDQLKDACVAQTGQANVYLDEVGRKCFFEASNKEHRDGAVTGSIMRDNPDGKTCRKVASFRIEGDGEVTRGPKFFKSMPDLHYIKIYAMGNSFVELYRGSMPIEENNLITYLKDWMKQFEIGGVNERVGKSLGLRYPHKAIVYKNGGTTTSQNVMFEWSAPSFMVW